MGKVAELARLRRRRLISQPRVAELARLPWVPERASASTLQRVARRVRRAAPVIFARGQMHQSEEALENPRDNRLPILKGLNCCGGVGGMPRGFGGTLAGLGGGFTRVPKVLFRLGHRTNSKNFRASPTHTALNPLQG